MARPTVLYFFAFRSPYAALADFRVDDLIESVGAELEPIPIVPPASDPPTGLAATLQESRVDYQREDTERWARRLSIPWNPPPRGPVDSRDAVAGYLYARERGRERHFRNAVFRSRWCEGKNIDDPNVLAECAEDCRFSPNDFLQALRSRVYHGAIDDALGRALENRVFGVPTFVFAGERFWGNDRLDFLVDAIRRRDAGAARG